MPREGRAISPLFKQISTLMHYPLNFHIANVEWSWILDCILQTFSAAKWGLQFTSIVLFCLISIHVLLFFPNFPLVSFRKLDRWYGLFHIYDTHCGGPNVYWFYDNCHFRICWSLEQLWYFVTKCHFDWWLYCRDPWWFILIANSTYEKHLFWFPKFTPGVEIFGTDCLHTARFWLLAPCTVSSLEMLFCNIWGWYKKVSLGTLACYHLEWGRKSHLYMLVGKWAGQSEGQTVSRPNSSSS
jgi:hypothetical protein